MQEPIYTYRWQIALLLVGAILLAGGIILTRRDILSPATVEMVADEATHSGQIRVEVSGKVKSPGVYALSTDARIDDALRLAGGITEEGDWDWVEKYINKAAKVTDGQKIYIPALNEQSSTLTANKQGGESVLSTASQNVSEGLININTATSVELEKLWGIGPVLAQKILEYRPYSSIDELLTKGIVKKNVWEKIKNQISVY